VDSRGFPAKCPDITHSKYRGSDWLSDLYPSAQRLHSNYPHKLNEVFSTGLLEEGDDAINTMEYRIIYSHATRLFSSRETLHITNIPRFLLQLTPWARISSSPAPPATCKARHSLNCLGLISFQRRLCSCGLHFSHKWPD
jgi:hypothetical protein